MHEAKEAEQAQGTVRRARWSSSEVEAQVRLEALPALTGPVYSKDSSLTDSHHQRSSCEPCRLKVSLRPDGWKDDLASRRSFAAPVASQINADHSCESYRNPSATSARTARAAA